MITTSPGFSVGTRDLLDVGHEQLSIDRAINGQRCGQAVAAKRADKGCRLPVPMRHGVDQTMATSGPAIAPRHVGLHPGFINENKP